MRTLLYYLKIYARCASQYIKGRMQYRADFIISMIAMLFVNLANIFVFRVLFTSIPSLAGWNFNQILFIYAIYLLSIAPVQLIFDNIWFLRYSIIDGSFIKYYLKPLNIMFYFMSERMDDKGFSQLGLGLAVLVYASSQLNLDWTPARILLLAVALLGSSLVASSIMIIAGTTAFWMMSGSPSVLNLALRMRDFAPYPTSVFDGFFRLLFTFVVPIGFVAFYPAQLFLKPGDIPFLAYLSPLMGIGFFMLACLVWQKGVDSYAGTGS
jgi:ABC-2 type transport system permease protein